MPFGDPTFDELETALALRHKAFKAAERIALRERTSRAMPPESRDDLAIVLQALLDMKMTLKTDLAAVRQSYMEKLNK